MKFTDYKTIKLATPPGVGENPPSGNIFVWETVSDTTLVINWRDSTGTDRTFSGGSGMENPMTAAGDIIIGGTSGSPERLAKGTAGQVLGMDLEGTSLTWRDETGGGSESTVQVLGTSGTQTINFATSDKWSLTPSAGVTLETSNEAEFKDVMLEIKNGGTNVSFPANWYWIDEIPVLAKSGVDKIKLQYVEIGSHTKIIAERLFSYLTYISFLAHFDNNANDSWGGITPTATDITYDNSSGEYKFGYSAVFNGSTSKISYADNSAFDVGLSSEPFTISFWYKYSEGGNCIVFSRAGSVDSWSDMTNGVQFKLQVVPSGGATVYYNSNGNYGLFNNTTSTLDDGNWHHIAAGYNGSTARLAVDGVWGTGASVASFYKPSASNQFVIGDDIFGGAAVSGKLDEFCIEKNLCHWPLDSNFTPPTLPFQ